MWYKGLFTNVPSPAHMFHSDVVKINSFNNEHNHPLTPMICEISSQFRKLTSKMLADIEKYVIQG
ncbi:8533_t:CDS:2, partial [Funneliformis mosseae]